MPRTGGRREPCRSGNLPRGTVCTNADFGTVAALRNAGFGLIDLLLALLVVGLLIGLAFPPVRDAMDRMSLKRSADVAQVQMQRTRLLAVARRETLRLRLSADHELVVLDSRDSVLAVTPLAGDGFVRLDSAQLRPATLRYNARGQAAPGSLYLYRGDRGIRLVSNFVGRVRRVRIPA